MAGFKMKPNHANFEKAVMRGPGTKRKLQSIGDKIAAAAGPGNEAFPGEGRTRSRVGVVTTNVEAMRSEAKHRSLTRAVDAGRE